MSIPNIKPWEIFELGAFGGTYWRPLYSKLSNILIEDDYKNFKELKNIPIRKLTSNDYDKKINFYKVKVGTTYDFWISKNWITKQSERGWVEWYFKYCLGERSNEDIKQFKRVNSVYNRFFKKIQKIKIKYPNKEYWEISPRICQTLLHWCIDVRLL